jgi:preprotein translocase subunit SecA
MRARRKGVLQVLVGTASVEESERLSRGLTGIPHHVLNARNEAEEAAIIARAGEQAAVTISTNMAGRGVDIRLGPGVAELGGLHVIGTNRHESRRIDHQLRGRAGRQGDPGSSQFFVSRQDSTVLKYGDGEPGVAPEVCQRRAEGQNLEARIFLRRYESVIEAQRQRIAERRQQILDGTRTAVPAGARHATLAIIDELWSDYLAAITELRSGSAWITLGYGNALGHYLREVHGMFRELEETIETTDPVDHAGSMPVTQDRGATWTYLTTDEPFGSMTARVLRRLAGRVDNQQEHG